jgi:hypothetical protein
MISPRAEGCSRRADFMNHLRFDYAYGSAQRE